MGSFLWCDVLAGAYGAHTAVATYAARERELLVRHRPPMLCLADLVMPAVHEITDAVELEWTCEAAPPRAAMGHRVAVLGGASGSDDEALARLATAARDDGLEVAVSSTIAARMSPPAERFSHDGGCATVDLVVCRPGAGTLCDCVAASTPIVAIDDGVNPEMTHNAQRVAELGLGLRADLDGALAAVSHLRDPVVWSRAVDRLVAMRKGGLAQAAQWLHQRIERPC
jgi:UDP:flavonoid glycosyltransferase YjiC (YdhE family)